MLDLHIPNNLIPLFNVANISSFSYMKIDLLWLQQNDSNVLQI